jgi:hypothetical protein
MTKQTTLNQKVKVSINNDSKHQSITRYPCQSAIGTLKDVSLEEPTRRDIWHGKISRI